MINYAKILMWAETAHIVWAIGAGCADLHSIKNGGDAMKNQFDFKDLMTFGLFLLALLTFVFTFCK